MRGLGADLPAVSLSPGDHGLALPDLAHVEHDLGRGEVLAGDQLLHPLAADAEHAADLGGPHEMMHAVYCSRLTSPRHVTRVADMSTDLNLRINTLIMRGLSATEAAEQARRELAEIEAFPCADVPYRCDGFDPADWPGEVPDFSAFAFLSQGAEPTDVGGRTLHEMVRDERWAECG